MGLTGPDAFRLGVDVTADQRLQQRYPYVVELPKRSGGHESTYDRAIDWLRANCEEQDGARWQISGLRVFFGSRADADRFAEAWPRILRS